VSDVPAEKGFEIFISSPMAVQARKASVELLLSNHSKDCQTCVKNGQCELLHVANITGAESGKYMGDDHPEPPSIWWPRASSGIPASAFCADAALKRCKDAQGIGILGFENVVSRPSLARPITAALLKCRAYSAANASKSARPAL
jgi:NADP-reducing hydrogenase subunit HndD